MSRRHLYAQPARCSPPHRVVTEGEVGPEMNYQCLPRASKEQLPWKAGSRFLSTAPIFYATAKTLGFDIDYKRLLKEFESRGTLVRAFYYTAIIEDQEFTSIRPLIDWLDYNGYTVVTKATKEFIDASGRRKVKGNMD